MAEWEAQRTSTSAVLLVPEMAGLWDNEDPEDVLAAVGRVADDRRSPPLVAGYARWVEGNLLLRLGRLEEAQEIFDGLGFVQQWMVIGPFDNDNEAGFDAEYPPEEHIGRALDLEATYEGRFHPVSWRAYPTPPYPEGATVLGTILEPSDASCAYLATTIESRRPQRAAIRLGFDGAMRVWVNGTSVFSDDGNRGATADRTAAGVMLQRGSNQIVVKSCNVAGGWNFYLRLTQPNGRRLTGVTISADPEALAADPPEGAEPFEVDSFWRYFFDQAGGEEAVLGPEEDDEEGEGEGAAEQGEGEAAAEQGEGEGGQEEQAVEPGEAEEAEAEAAETGEDEAPEVPARAHAELARFISYFGADDPSEHVARDQAQAAVDADPTVDNLRLLAQLHPDRNERLRALRRALELEPNRVDVMMSLAGIITTGPHPEDALELIARAEGLEPDNLTVRIARIDILNSFGLSQTALAMVRELAEQHPNGRMHAVLRAVANDAGNVEVEYQALERFFQTHLDSGSIRVALADYYGERGDHERAIEVLVGGLDYMPSSIGLRNALAVLYEAAGQLDESLAMRREAIDLRPDDGGLHQSLAHFLDRQGRDEEAVAAARRSLELRPENPWLRQWLSVVSSEDRFEGPYVEEADTFLARRGQGQGHDVRTLLDLGVRKVHQSGQSDEFRQLVFEAVTLQGARNLGSYRVAFTPHRQRLRVERARVHRPDGTTREAVGRYTRNVYDASIRMYYDLRITTISFGDLQPGDVVEIRYRISDVGRSNELGNYFGEVNVLQSFNPRARFSYVLMAPRDREIFFNEPGLQGLQHRVEQAGEETIHVFEANDVPALSMEAGMPPLAEVSPILLASTYQSWEELGRWYWTLVRDQLELDGDQRRRATELVEGATTDLERVRAIHRHVVRSVRYVALEFGVHRFKPYRVADIERRGFGDCKDQASLMIAMLAHVGVPAEIVLLRTRYLGRGPDSPPSLEVFNHAIVYVPSLDLYIDPTAERVAVGDLPSGDQGVMAMRVSASDVTLTTIPMEPAAEQGIRIAATLVLDEEGTARGQLTRTSYGWYAGVSRARLDDPGERVNYLERVLSNYLQGLRVSDVATSDVNELDSDTEVTMMVEVPGFARREGSDLSFPASIARPLTSMVSLPERQFDLVLGPPDTWTEEIDIELPPGRRATNIPEPVDIDSPIARFRLAVTHEPNGPVRLRSSIEWRAERVTPEQYPDLRRFVEQVTEARNARVRLVTP